MDIRVNLNNIVEIAGSIGPGEFEFFLDMVKKTARTVADLGGKPVLSVKYRPVAETNCAAAAKPVEPPPVARESDFIPASDQALRALYGAARSNGMDVETVCKEYSVDPSRISKDECRKMTSDLNKKSGYDKIQKAWQQENSPNDHRISF